MNWKYAFFFLLISFFVVNCSRTKDVAIPQVSSKILNPNDIQAFHPEMVIKIGWVPYQGQKLVQTKNNEWRVIPHSEDDKISALPTMIIDYPDSEESVMIDMAIDNKLLGKLIKHSAMTMVPISRPYSEFFEKAKCESCHPADVEVDFGFMDYLDDDSSVTTLIDQSSYTGIYSK